MAYYGQLCGALTVRCRAWEVPWKQKKKEGTDWTIYTVHAQQYWICDCTCGAVDAFSHSELDTRWACDDCTRGLMRTKPDATPWSQTSWARNDSDHPYRRHFKIGDEVLVHYKDRRGRRRTTSVDACIARDAFRARGFTPPKTPPLPPDPPPPSNYDVTAAVRRVTRQLQKDYPLLDLTDDNAVRSLILKGAKVRS